MKFHFLALFTGTIVTLIGSTLRAEAQTVSILADPWCPYTCEASGDKPGFLIDVAKAALKDSPYKVDYKIMAWARALDEVRKSQANAAAGATETDKDGMVLSPKLISSATCFYAKKSTKWTFSNVSSLEKVTLGAIAGYTYDEAVDGYIEKNKTDTKKIQLVSGDNPLPQNVKKLQADRIQVLLEDKNVVDYFFANNGGPGDIEEKFCLPPAEVYIAFGARNPMTSSLVKTFEAGLAKAKSSGEFAKILAKYGLK